MFALTALGVVLVASHQGEFWPYSIYPMFSQGGRAWRRALARDVSALGVTEYWRLHTLETLPGTPFALEPHGLPQIDFTEYVNQVKSWNAAQVAGLRAMFAPHLQGRTLLVYQVRGDVDATGRSITQATPLVLLAPRETAVNPERASPRAQRP